MADQKNLYPKTPRVGVGAVIVHHGMVLLQRRLKPPEKGAWNIPGGAVEWGETLEHAVIREVEEEIGVTAAVRALICITDHIVPEEDAHWVSPAYLIDVISGTPVNIEPAAASEIAWFPLTELPRPLTIVAQNALASLSKLDTRTWK